MISNIDAIPSTICILSQMNNSFLRENSSFCTERIRLISSCRVRNKENAEDGTDNERANVDILIKIGKILSSLFCISMRVYKYIYIYMCVHADG